MKPALLCPQTEICFVYRVYVDHTGDERLGIIKVLTMENRDFYGCEALNKVLELLKSGQVGADVAQRFDGSLGCLLIDQANKNVPRHRHDV